MANSVMIDPRGPDWPLGFIKVVTPGIPVSIMSLVDPNGVNNPNNPQPPAAVGGVVTIPAGVLSYTPKANQIVFMAFKPGAAHGSQLNGGYIYVVRAGVQGAGNRDDYGAIVQIMTPGQTFVVPNTPSGPYGDILSPYRYFVDADNAGDGAFVTAYMLG